MEAWVPCQDYLGVNYYSRARIGFSFTHPRTLFCVPLHSPEAVVSDLGWEIYPEGLGRSFRAVHKRYGKPIWVTENGIADCKDEKRGLFLIQHLAEVANGLREGIPIQGYCHWSLLDNFEWADGFSPRFGLYAIDYLSQKRTPRPSAAIFARIAASHSLEEYMPAGCSSRHIIESSHSVIDGSRSDAPGVAT